MKTLHHTLLIGNGTECSPRQLKAWARQADFVLAADGGARHALRAGIVPDAIIGDLDSVTPSIKKRFARARWICVHNQDKTDFSKAMDFLVQNGCKQCLLTGFTGGRMDFTLGNLLAVYPYASRLEICLAGDGWKMYPVVQKKTFQAPLGTRVSILSLKTCSGVTSCGLKFPLRHSRLTLGTTRTLSNLTSRNNFSISLKTGALLVYVEDKPAKSSY